MEKNKQIGAVIISIGVVVFALVFAYSAYSFSKQGSYVEVKGLSERVVKADIAIWSINFEVKAKDVESLYAQMDKNISFLKSYLLTQGFEESEINFAPPNIYQDTYSEALFRYNATVPVSLYTKKVDQVRTASRDTLPLIKEGIVMNNSYISFEFSDLNSVKPEMLAEAIENAKVSAAEFAKASGSSVGQIARANQGVIDISEKDPGSPEYKKIRVVSTLRFLLK